MVSATSAALSGLRAAQTRLDVSASNVANMNSTGRMPDETGASNAYQPLAVQQQALASGGTRADVVRQNAAYRPAYQPDSPDANAQGMVATPNVDLVVEASNQLQARLSYAATIKTMQTAFAMQQTLLDTFR